LIDARSSRPPVKEDDVDRDKRHESTEKQKSAKDLEKKKEKKKNLERQALEKRRVERCRGENLRRNLLMKTMATTRTTIATTPRGWRLASTKSLRARHRPTLTSRGRGPLRGRRAGPVMVNRGSPLRAALAPTPPNACTGSGRLPPATSSRVWGRPPS